jgi:hypothetical protein
MAGVDTRCTHLTTLLDMGDLERVEHVVRSAANLWLAGRAAYRRLAERDEATSPHVVVARRRLDSSYLLLLNLLKRAHTAIPDHAMRSKLDDVRIELVTAAAQPIDDAAATAGATCPGDTQEMAVDD